MSYEEYQQWVTDFLPEGLAREDFIEYLAMLGIGTLQNLSDKHSIGLSQATDMIFQDASIIQ